MSGVGSPAIRDKYVHLMLANRPTRNARGALLDHPAATPVVEPSGPRRVPRGPILVVVEIDEQDGPLLDVRRAARREPQVQRPGRAVGPDQGVGLERPLLMSEATSS